ncbi:MAG: hypothetical protein WCT49_00900 [Candidatus Paceibacterota bacterium]|jgi:pimeloyl-ACP methyl ester carboxylesterase|nr:hypothetical protein [Candidatus Paceibacterota bacterium]
MKSKYAFILVVASLFFFANFADARTIGAVLNGKYLSPSVTVFDIDDNNKILGNVTLPPGRFFYASGDVFIAKAQNQTVAFVTTNDRKVFVIDLSSDIPKLASGVNPILISNSAGDITMSTDGEFLIVSGSTSGEPISIINIASRQELGTFSGATNVNSVDICSDGSLLMSSSSGNVRRFTINNAGGIIDTGELLPVVNPRNVVCSPDGRTGIIISSNRITSFRVSGMTPISNRSLSYMFRGISGVFSASGDRFFVRECFNPFHDGEIKAFAYDSNSGQFGTSLFTISATETSEVSGIEQLAVDPDGTRLYVPSMYYSVSMYDAHTGSFLSSSPFGLMYSTGIAVAMKTVQSNVTILANASVTEDDGINDAKGVAEKTSFSFGVQYKGIVPNSVRAIIENNNGTLIGLELYATSTDYANGVFFSNSSTFPKGQYSYRFEATAEGNTLTLAGGNITAGYSNVAFLPGIKASRLFNQGDVLEDQLWEPNWWSDTNELMMNPDGTSENENIYTKTDEYLGTIDQANVLPGSLLRENFYVSFLDFMNSMKENGEIADWKSLPYDWRLAFPRILNQGNSTVNGKIFYDDRYATDTPYILQEIRALAQSSDTGKVNIIGHSMGGLLAKKLLVDHADIANMTDTLILVDSPQLGTPQAVATILHGTNENIPSSFGLFSDAETGRRVAQNMPSVYTLLPSREYAERVEESGLGYSALIKQDASLQSLANDPLFVGGSVLDFYQTKYGTTTIATYDGMKDFLGGKDGHLSAPDNDIIHPKRIQMDMLADAQAIHDEIDNWTPSEKMRVVQIAGWGIPETIRGLNYRAKRSCIWKLCTEPKFDVEPLFTFDGDGTVTLPSQTAMNTETYYVDLNSHNFLLIKDRSHGSVLEVESVRKLINNLVEYKDNPSGGLEYIKTDKSRLVSDKKFIRLSLHSPVKIDVTDKSGNHLGISENSTAEKIVYDTEMPNSYYVEMGEGKYLGFPLETETTIDLEGTGEGTFTLEMEQYQGDILQGTQTFTDIPVSPTTRATLIVNTLGDAKELALDQNGDGSIDSVVFTDENKETITFQTLEDALQKLPDLRPALLNQAETAEKQFNIGNFKATNALLLVLQKEIPKLSQGNTSNEEYLKVLAIIDVLIKTSEENIL